MTKKKSGLQPKFQRFKMFYAQQKSVPALLHDSMFTFCLKHFADENQQAKWLGLAERKEILGTYAQTEVLLFYLITFS